MTPRHGTMQSSWSLILLWIVLTGASLHLRPLLLIDETRYIAVAWEMWHSGDYLVPHLNGEVYSHKPPLLFWLINAGWAVFGVREWVARMVGPAFGLLDVFALGTLARTLWPSDAATQTRVGALLLAFPFFGVYSTTLMFDTMLTFFLLIALTGLVLASRTRSGADWHVSAYVALGVGGGVLAKGPIILLYLVPVIALTPWWSPDVRTAWRPFVSRVAAGALGGICIGLAWAIPAAIVGGPEYREAILWTQSAGRVTKSFAHERPFWFYLMFVPLLLFPWLYWAPMYAAFRRGLLQDHGLRFCTAWFLGGFLLLCLISGKQIHYLLPLLPGTALFVARSMNAQIMTVRRPVFLAVVYALLGTSAFLMATRPVAIGSIEIALSIPSSLAAITLIIGGLTYIRRARSIRMVVWGATAACVVLIVGAHLLAGPGLREVHNMTSVARKLAALQAADAPVIHIGAYQGQFTFAGRFTQPIPVAETDEELTAWCAKNPNGYVIRYWRGNRNRYDPDADIVTPYRGRMVGVVHAHSPKLLDEIAANAGPAQARKMSEP